MTDKLNRIVVAKRPCPDRGQWHELTIDCRHGCKGSGRVFIFGPEVREPCLVCAGTGKTSRLVPDGQTYERKSSECVNCQGRGVVATQDLAKLQDAAEKLEDIEITSGKGFTSWIHYGDVYQSGFEQGPVKERTLKALGDALLASGAKLGDVKDNGV